MAGEGNRYFLRTNPNKSRKARENEEVVSDMELDSDESRRSQDVLGALEGSKIRNMASGQDRDRGEREEDKEEDALHKGESDEAEDNSLRYRDRDTLDGTMSQGLESEEYNMLLGYKERTPERSRSHSIKSSRASSPIESANIMGELLKALNKKFENLETKLEQNKNEMKENSEINMKRMEEKLEKNKNEMKENSEKNMKRMEEKFEERDKKWKTEIEAIIKGIKEIDIRMDTRCNKYEEDIKTIGLEIRENIKAEVRQIEEKIENEVEIVNQKVQKAVKEIQQLGGKCDEMEQRIKETRETNTNDIGKLKTEIGQEVERVSDKVEQLEDKVKGNHKGMLTSVPIYLGQAGEMWQPPKFNYRQGQPKTYIKKMKNYLERNQMMRDIDIMQEVIEKSLDSHAGKWFEMMRSSVMEWKHFEELFLKKFWSSEIQRGIKLKMDWEKYIPERSLTRSEYFVERVIQLRDMEPVIPEEEIVERMKGQFDDQIRRVCWEREVNTIRKFEELLTSMDMEDRNKRLQENRAKEGINNNRRAYGQSREENRNDNKRMRMDDSPRQERRRFDQGYNNNRNRRTYQNREQEYKREDYNQREGGNNYSYNRTLEVNRTQQEDRRPTQQQRTMEQERVIRGVVNQKQENNTLQGDAKNGYGEGRSPL